MAELLGLKIVGCAAEEIGMAVNVLVFVLFVQMCLEKFAYYVYLSLVGARRHAVSRRHSRDV